MNYKSGNIVMETEVNEGFTNVRFYTEDQPEPEGIFYPEECLQGDEIHIPETGTYWFVDFNGNVEQLSNGADGIAFCICNDPQKTCKIIVQGQQAVCWPGDSDPCDNFCCHAVLEISNNQKPSGVILKTDVINLI